MSWNSVQNAVYQRTKFFEHFLHNVVSFHYYRLCTQRELSSSLKTVYTTWVLFRNHACIPNVSMYYMLYTIRRHHHGTSAVRVFLFSPNVLPLLDLVPMGCTHAPPSAALLLVALAMNHPYYRFVCKRVALGNCRNYRFFIENE